jgi:hypothetical protein
VPYCIKAFLLLFPESSSDEATDPSVQVKEMRVRGLMMTPTVASSHNVAARVDPCEQRLIDLMLLLSVDVDFRFRVLYNCRMFHSRGFERLSSNVLI